MDAANPASISGSGALDIAGFDLISPNYDCIGAEPGRFHSESVLKF
jgi:hypothetical protein